MSSDVFDVVAGAYYPKQMAAVAEPVVLVSFEDGRAVHMTEEMSRERAEEMLETLIADAANTQPGKRIRIMTPAEAETLLRVSPTLRKSLEKQVSTFVNRPKPNSWRPPQFPLADYLRQAQTNTDITIHRNIAGTVVVAPDGEVWRLTAYRASGGSQMETKRFPNRAMAESNVWVYLRALAEPAARTFRESSKHGF